MQDGKGGNLPFAEVGQVTYPMKVDEAPDPVRVALGRARAVMFTPNRRSDLVKQLRLLCAGRIHRHGVPSVASDFRNAPGTTKDDLAFGADLWHKGMKGCQLNLATKFVT